MDRAQRISPSVLTVLVANRAEFLSFLERRVGSPELAEELLQRAFVRGIERGGAIRDDESAVAWFYRVLRNAMVDHVRRTATADRALRRWAADLAASQDADEPPPRRVCKCVSILVGTLKPEYAAVLHGMDMEGMSAGEFAKNVGITSNNAAVRLHRARTALGERVRATCGTCASDGCLDCCCV